MKTFSIEGRVVDLAAKTHYPAKIEVSGGKIASITKLGKKIDSPYILPGFIDAHVHIESSMMIPSEFARIAATHGTVATVSDPHEIANVLGIQGVRYMIENGKKVPFHFYFGVPSCVPATPFETAGATLGKEEIEKLFKEDALLYLSEMMNYPAVLHRDPLVMDKLEVAKKYNRPVDGHAPGLMGEQAKLYATAGISTDHECFKLQEALDKIECGMQILIREGSAAKNYEALHTLLKSHPEKVMFSSDDKHPNDLACGHIDQLVRRSVVEKGYPVMDVLRAACYNPVKHYGLDVGLLQPGDSADFIVVDNLNDFRVLKTYIKGQLVAEMGKPLIDKVSHSPINCFKAEKKSESDFAVKDSGGLLNVIEAFDGELVTGKLRMNPHIENGFLTADPSQDLLKIVVVNRYKNEKPAVAFIKGFGLKSGAIASSIAHDCHNVISVGATDAEIAKAVNAVIAVKGGISVVNGENIETLALPIGGIMSGLDGYEIAEKYAKIDKCAKELGSSLKAPFMTLSFMALLVIPSLKLSDKGLFDGESFTFLPLQN